MIASQETHHAEIARYFYLFERVLILLFVLGLVASGRVAIGSDVSHVGEGPVGRAAGFVLVQRIKMNYRRAPGERCLLFDFLIAVSCAGLDRLVLVVVCNIVVGRRDTEDLIHIVYLILFLRLLVAIDHLKSDLKSQV